MPSAKPTVKFLTLGCKANQYDTQSIRESFLSRGFQEAYTKTFADYYLINTCTVTAGADQKSLQLIRRCIQSSRRARVIVTGCLAQKDYMRLAKIKGISLIAQKPFFRKKPITGFSQHTRAFLKVQDGCDNFCSYCKVALVRGKPRSKKLAEVLAEAKSLVDRGYKEIVLTGICLGTYGKDLKGKTTLLNLLDSLEKLQNLCRIRLSSIEPQDIDKDLVEYLSQSPKACRHLHIPLQSGDDRILKAMNRRYSSRDFEKLIGGLTKKIPGFCLTTDCMIGFPGEEEVNFLNTVNLIKKASPLKVHIFPYSARPLTKAAEFTDLVNPLDVRRRCLDLTQVALGCRHKVMRSFQGSIVQVLIERQTKDDPAYLEGFSDNYLPVKTPFKNNLVNCMVAVKLKKTFKDGLIGEYVDKV